MLTAVIDPPAPPEIVALAEERARARAARDWHGADELRDRIEAAGWRVLDDDLAFSLSPARQPDIVEGSRTIHGSPDAVPSRADEPDAPGSSVVLIVEDPRGSIGAPLGALRDGLPAGTPVLVVAAHDVDPAELAPASEIVWTVEPWPAGAALRAALRRLGSSTVTVVRQGLVADGDVVTPLATLLADETVAIAGAAGLLSRDLWHEEPGGPGEVTFVTADCYAFRRQDLLACHEVDDRLQSAAGLAMWLSLTLRDEGEGAPPRRALATALPLHPSSQPAVPQSVRTGMARRDRYRIATRFKARPDLLQPGPGHEDEPAQERDSSA